MDIDTSNPSINTNTIQIEPIEQQPIDSNNQIETSNTETAQTTDSISLSPLAVNVSKADTDNKSGEVEIQDPEQEATDLATSIEANPELALAAQSNQLTSATVQSLIG